MKRWLKLIEAAEYSSIGEERLKEMARTGIIKGCQDKDSKRKDWIFDKESIDAYWETQMIQKTVRDEALAIMGRFKI